MIYLICTIHLKWDRCPRDMLMAQFVLCVHVVIWQVLHVRALCRVICMEYDFETATCSGVM